MRLIGRQLLFIKFHHRFDLVINIAWSALKFKEPISDLSLAIVKIHGTGLEKEHLLFSLGR